MNVEVPICYKQWKHTSLVEFLIKSDNYYSLPNLGRKLRKACSPNFCISDHCIIVWQISITFVICIYFYIFSLSLVASLGMNKNAQNLVRNPL